jgi:RecA-family ATPase
MEAEGLRIINQAHDKKIPLPKNSLRTQIKTRYSASEILSIKFPDDVGPIPGIIPIGLTIIGSRPKVGKSRLLLQASCSWGVGGKFLDITMPHLRVLFYSLDDPERRLQTRLNKLCLDPTASITFEREITPLNLGGIAEIEHEANSYDIIVIDTIRRAMPGKDFNKDGALYDDILGQLQTIAQNKHISIIVVLHTRKSIGQDFDPIDDVLGSTGLTASADCVLAIYRQPNKTSALFKGRNKDFGDIDLTIEFDPISYAWQLVGITGDVLESENENEILEAMPDLGRARVAEIAKAIGKDRSNTSRRCAKLWTKGRLQKDVEGNITYYYLPTLPTQDTHHTQATQ